LPKYELNLNPMEKLIKYLQESYGNEIIEIKHSAEAELEIRVGQAIIVNDFSQKLQDDLVNHIDKFDIIKINIIDADGNLKDSFATNQ
jgi:hypothetical protein